MGAFMERIDELKDIIWKLNLLQCNLVQYIDKRLSGELLNSLIDKFNSYSDHLQKYFPLLIDAKELQKTFINMDDNIVKYADVKGILVPDGYYQLIELRKTASVNNNLDDLRKFKEKIFKLEKTIKDSQVEDIKHILVEEYLSNLFPYKLLCKYPSLKSLISEENLEEIKRKLEFLTNSDIDLAKLMEMETIFYDYDSFYRLLTNNNKDFQIMVPAIIMNGESIVDYDLQENINYHMWNQRSGVFTMNFITEDTIYHRSYKNWYLEETHDIITTNVKSKRYYRDIHNSTFNFHDLI